MNKEETVVLITLEEYEKIGNYLEDIKHAVYNDLPSEALVSVEQIYSLLNFKKGRDAILSRVLEKERDALLESMTQTRHQLDTIIAFLLGQEEEERYVYQAFPEEVSGTLGELLENDEVQIPEKLRATLFLLYKEAVAIVRSKNEGGIKNDN